MRSSKPWRFVLRLCAFLLVLCVVFAGLNYLMVNTNTFMRLALHELYTSQQNIDLLVLGSSVAYLSFDPAVLEAQTGLHTFTLGSGNQPLVATEALLREVLATNHPKACIYAMHWNVLTQPARGTPFYNYPVLDALRPSWNRLGFLLQAYPGELLLRGLVPFTRADEKRDLNRNLTVKRSAAFREYAPSVNDSEKLRYVGQGFVAGTPQVPGQIGPVSLYMPPQSASISLTLNEDALSHLLALKRLCEANGIALLLCATPTPMASMATLNRQDEITALYREVAKRTALPMLDYNLWKQPLGDADFCDDTHMSVQGAAQFSASVGSVLWRALEGDSLSDLFYPDYAAMVASDARLYNVWLSVQGQTATATTTQGALAVPEFSFSIGPTAEGPFQLMAPYGAAASVNIAQCTPGWYLRVYARNAADPQGATQRHTLRLPK